MKTLVLASPHERGPEVSDAQNKLYAAGFLAAPANGEFGPLTMQACRRAHFWLGFAGELEYAPTYGDKLDAMLDVLLKGDPLPQPNGKNRAARVAAAKKGKPLGAKALAKAITQLGTKESPAGSNHQKYGVWYGVDRVAWCAIFVTWNYVTGAASKVFAKGSRYAYVPYIVADAGAGRNNLALTSDPQPGDIVCFDWEQNGVADHTGLFEKWIDRGKSFYSIEGNTGIGNDSNGGEVMRRTRAVSSLARYQGHPVFVRVGK